MPGADQLVPIAAEVRILEGAYLFHNRRQMMRHAMACVAQRSPAAHDGIVVLPVVLNPGIEAGMELATVNLDGDALLL